MMQAAIQVIRRSDPEASLKAELAFPSREQSVIGETALASGREFLGFNNAQSVNNIPNNQCENLVCLNIRRREPLILVSSNSR